MACKTDATLSIIKLLTLALSLYSIGAQASPLRLPKVIYGEDNRTLMQNYPDSSIKNVARSTAAMFDKTKLKKDDNGNYKIVGASSLKEAFNVCPDESFSQELSAASCSGFLVAPNLLLTAGHCINTASECRGSVWVFDYTSNRVNKEHPVINAQMLYRCQSIMLSAYDVKNDLDYSLIELDREVTDRLPLLVRTDGKVESDEELVAIGHPSGLPTIIADGGFAYKNEHSQIFGANLDTFSINSGSVVINKKTKEVEGILIRGQMDYVLDREQTCLRPNLWRQDNYPGETITRITAIPELLRYL